MRLRRTGGIVGAVCVCVVLGATIGARQRDTGIDRVAFTTSRPGNWDVFLFEGPGQPPRRLTMHPGLDYDPAISPDGRWLIFCSERDGDPDLYVLDLTRGGDPRMVIDADSLEDQATFAPDGRSIAFVSTYGGNADIYVLPFRPDTTLSMADAENVTQHPRADLRPAFAPDGRRIAFSSDRDSEINSLGPIGRIRDGDIYILDLNTRQTRRVTNTAGWDGSPAWSSDGQMIAFYSQRGMRSANRLTVQGAESWSRPEARIWIINADGSSPRLLTPTETLALSPHFLADGRVAYSRKRPDGVWQIVSIATDGSGARVESDSSTRSYWKPASGKTTSAITVHASESPGLPDGQRMNFPFTFAEGPFLTAGAPFRRTLPDRQIDLFPIRTFNAILHPLINLLVRTGPGNPGLTAGRMDGSDTRTFFRYLARGPDRPGFQNPGDGFRWSRDGEWLLITQGDSSFNAATEADIWKTKADGSALQNLTPNSPGNDNHPNFSGDGKQIVFRSSRSGAFDLYLMNADGTNVRRLTEDAGNDLFPVFSPTRNQIAFASNRADPSTRVYEIYLLDLLEDGRPGSIRRLTNTNTQKGHMAFSYDGQWLVYSSEEGGINDEEPLVQSVVFAGQSYGDMYALRVSDGRQIRLSHNKWEEGVPSWEAAVRP